MNEFGQEKLKIISKGNFTYQNSSEICDLSTFFNFNTQTNASVLKKGITWEHVKKAQHAELKKMYHLSSRKSIHLIMYCHLSIAFFAGRLYGRCFEYEGAKQPLKEGIILEGFHSGQMRPSQKPSADHPYENLQFKIYNGNGIDDILVISIKQEIDETVNNYLNKKGINYRRFIYAHTDDLIKDGAHLKQISDILETKILEEKNGRKGDLHIFGNCTVHLMFLLGTVSDRFGRVHLYEYHMYGDASGDGYAPSFII